MAPKGAIRLFGPVKSQKMENVKSHQAPVPEQDVGFFRLWWRSSRESLFKQQRRALWGEHQSGLWNEVRATVVYARVAWRDRRPQVLTETWESLCARKGYTEEAIADGLRRALHQHWLMYAVAGVVVVYAAWLMETASVMAGLVAFAPAVGALVCGYCAGYRAWQLQHRRLIRFVDALRIRGTYLVL